MNKTLFASFAAVVLLAAGLVSADSVQSQLAHELHGNHAPVCPKGGNNPDDAHCHAHVTTDEKGNPHVTQNAVTGYGPQQLQTAYGIVTPPSTTWQWNGKTVAIVDAYDNPKAEADLATYSTTFGLPQCTNANGCFKKVNQTGGNKMPRGNQGWALEIALDVQAVHAMCPNCKILLVEATSNSFGNLIIAEDYATSHADVVSNSWGGSEFSSQTSASYDGHFNRPGKPITVSSGDNGYGVEFPASSRYVTAVGGTTLLLNPDNTRASETTWSGSGSGCSAYEPKPVWQTDTGCSKRTVADVAAVADPNTGAAVYDSYGYNGQTGWFRIGGTSLAAPLVAAVYAMAGNGAATIAGSYPYSHSASLFDITSGSNGVCGGTYLCVAVSGYDGPTGLGSPNGLSAF